MGPNNKRRKSIYLTDGKGTSVRNKQNYLTQNSETAVQKGAVHVCSAWSNKMLMKLSLKSHIIISDFNLKFCEYQLSTFHYLFFPLCWP